MNVSGLVLLASMLAPWPAGAAPQPVEIHDVLVPQSNANMRVALTLDACSGKFDDDLIKYLIHRRIPATIFATKKWLDKNPHGLSVIKQHLDLFDVEDHGENHIPAVIGAGRKVYGIPGEPDMIHLRREVEAGAAAVEEATGVPAHWYRGATADTIRRQLKKSASWGLKLPDFQ